MNDELFYTRWILQGKWAEKNIDRLSVDELRQYSDIVKVCDFLVKCHLMLIFLIPCKS